MSDDGCNRGFVCQAGLCVIDLENPMVAFLKESEETQENEFEGGLDGAGKPCNSDKQCTGGQKCTKGCCKLPEEFVFADPMVTAG